MVNGRAKCLKYLEKTDERISNETRRFLERRPVCFDVLTPSIQESSQQQRATVDHHQVYSTVTQSLQNTDRVPDAILYPSHRPPTISERDTAQKRAQFIFLVGP